MFANLQKTNFTLLMSLLLHKSNENCRSSELLIEQSFYSSSVHCSYYSCVQLMIYILINKEGKSEEDIKTEQENVGKNFHVYLINTFITKLRNDRTYHYYRNTIGKLTELKILRVKADYKNAEILESEATEANTLSKRIIEDLKIINSIE